VIGSQQHLAATQAASVMQKHSQAEKEIGRLKVFLWYASQVVKVDVIQRAEAVVCIPVWDVPFKVGGNHRRG
jgi:lipid-binding SYLF domain-containing protein